SVSRGCAMSGCAISGSAVAISCRAVALVMGLSAMAQAHHAPGHGASEGIRAANSLAGRSARATERLMLLEELSAPTDQPGGAQSLQSTTSLVGSVLLHPWFSLGAQLPWVVVNESSKSTATTGYGDTTLEAIVTPYGDWLRHRIPSFGVRVSLPTRSFELVADPGKTYAASPFAAFTRRYESAYWQAVLLSTLETRPAGWAWDMSSGLSVGYEVSPGLSLALGTWVDVRLLAYCKNTAGSSSYCEEGRVTERERETFATRAYGLLNAAYTIGAFQLQAGAQLPFTEKRDFLYSGFLSAEWSF
ncbi:MAG TPA: hypothetical protein VFU02_23445, partial [Polyangiaceae bacterium]|nr:hypothetical protein [Polyangiaceae bacterium]